MKISKNGLINLKTWEGSVVRDGLHRPYDDDNGREVQRGGSFVGYLTVGYGHLLDKSELNLEALFIGDDMIEYWNGLTESQALSLLDEDLDWAEEAVRNGVEVEINQNQFDALVSFTFNTGGTAFRKSTLLQLLNRGLHHEVPTQMARWNRSGGRVMQGLIRRRQHEADLWNL